MRHRLLSLDEMERLCGPPPTGRRSPPIRPQLDRAAALLKTLIAKELTPRQRECVVRYYYQQETMEAIGQELGIGKPAVCRHLQRARRRLGKVLSYAAFLSPGGVRRKPEPGAGHWQARCVPPPPAGQAAAGESPLLRRLPLPGGVTALPEACSCATMRALWRKGRGLWAIPGFRGSSASCWTWTAPSIWGTGYSPSPRGFSGGWRRPAGSFAFSPTTARRTGRPTWRSCAAWAFPWPRSRCTFPTTVILHWLGEHHPGANLLGGGHPGPGGGLPGGGVRTERPPGGTW